MLPLWSFIFVKAITNLSITLWMVFTIRYRIDQAIKLQDISKIVVITDAIPATKQIFNTSVYLYQLHSITISKNLRKFFKKNSNNSISFWNYPDSIKWSLYSKVNKELKYIKIDPILPSKMSWKFSRKEEYDSIIHR